ncbi:hypothetical protein Hanom_Chr11g01028031 [Helianthus anomalus]
MTYLDGVEENMLDSRDVIRKKVTLIAQDEEDVIENYLIIESYLDLVDLIMLHEELVGHELFYDASMEEIINWFLPCVLGICKEGETPPTLLKGNLLIVVSKL